MHSIVKENTKKQPSLFFQSCWNIWVHTIYVALLNIKPIGTGTSVKEGKSYDVDIFFHIKLIRSFLELIIVFSQNYFRNLWQSA